MSTTGAPGQKHAIYKMRNTDERPLGNHDSKWLKLQSVTYVESDGTSKEWERVVRASRQEGATVDAACVIAILTKKRAGRAENDTDTLEYPRLLLLKQYRPPVGGISVEFAAGLLDPKESPEECAMRELKEETGYTGQPIPGWSSTFACTDAGIGGTFIQSTIYEIDMNRPENQNPEPKHEGDEYIETFSLPISTLRTELIELMNDPKHKYILDARVMAFAGGIEMARRMSSFV